MGAAYAALRDVEYKSFEFMAAMKSQRADNFAITKYIY